MYFTVNSKTEGVRIYELQLTVIDEFSKEPANLLFAFAGDIVEENVKENQMNYDWGLFFVEIPLSELRDYDKRR